MRKILGTKLRDIRDERNETLTEVAAAVKVDRTYLSKIENGVRNPSVEILSTLLDHYGIESMDKRNELLELAGYLRVTAVNMKIESSNWGGGVSGMDDKQKSAVNEEPKVKVPENINILYSDAIYVTVSQYGLVLDFAQRLGPTSNHNVVARIGISKEHGKALLKVLVGKVGDMELIQGKKEKS